MSLMFDPQLALVVAAATVAWLGLGWLVGRDRGLVRAGWTAGAAGIVLGLASGRTVAVAAGVVILACWLACGRRLS